MTRYFVTGIVLSLIFFDSSSVQEKQAPTLLAPQKKEEPKSHGKVVSFFEDVFKSNKPNKESGEMAFKQYILESPLPVVVKFTLPGCGQCATVKSVFNQLAQDYAGKIRFVDIDIEAFEPLSESKEVKTMPTILYINEGIEVGRDTGPQTINQVRNRLKELFKLA